MAKEWLFTAAVYLILLKFLVQAIESPPYTVFHSEAEMEIRLYRDSAWMSAPVADANSFETSTRHGFHRLYEYTHGGNLNSTEITLTAPVLTRITNGSDYLVRFYLPSKYEANPPQPFPQLNLQLHFLRNRCVAVRKFSGFAKDENIDLERESLLNSLERVLKKQKKTAPVFSVAQYNAPSDTTERLNEVWINVSGYGEKLCSTH